MSDAPVLATQPTAIAPVDFSWSVQRVPAGTLTASGPLPVDRAVMVLTTAFGPLAFVFSLEAAKEISDAFGRAVANVVVPTQQDIVDAISAGSKRKGR